MRGPEPVYLKWLLDEIERAHLGGEEVSLFEIALRVGCSYETAHRTLSRLEHGGAVLVFNRNRAPVPLVMRPTKLQ